MINYTGFQWLLIDAANQYGYDKMTFEQRISWAESNLHDLEEFAQYAETKSMFIKAVMAVRKAQAGVPTGHMVGVDAVCSGIQLMSAMTGCVSGATATGLVTPDKRADAYGTVTTVMNRILGGGFSIPRSHAKDATMKSFYGSKAEPKIIFGEDTPELAAFYEAANEVAPGAWELLQDLLGSWQPFALSHQWKLPDGFDARVKVMSKQESRIEVDELEHATFTYQYYDNVGTKKGLSNAANVIHSVDAFVLREMHRRCNYNCDSIEYVAQCVEAELLERIMGVNTTSDEFTTDKMDYYMEQFKRSGSVSAAILPYLDQATVSLLSIEHLKALSVVVNNMLMHKSFPLVTVHDEFRAHANNVNQVRFHYKEILAELADSTILDDLLSQIHGSAGTFKKLSNDLSNKIRESNYALC